VPVQEQQQRSGAGFQVLGFHPVDRDPAIMKSSHTISGDSLT
jgi:hypothetical protein